MTRKFFVSLFLISLAFSTQITAFAADAPVKLKKGERLFNQDYDKVWDATIAVITEKGFAVHPHKNMKIKKEKGRVQTPEWRYFKIWSASPVVEKQYKDSYKINLKKIEVPAPGAAPVAEKPTEPAKTETKPEKTAAEAPATDGAVAKAEAAPPAVPTVTKIKISIKRKFLVHNDEKRTWDKGDPNKEMAGYSVEDLFKAIEEKLATANPAVDPAKHVNLNINPLPVDKVQRP